MNELVQDDTAAPYSHEIESFQTVMEPVEVEEGSVSYLIIMRLKSHLLRQLLLLHITQI